METRGIERWVWAALGIVVLAVAAAGVLSLRQTRSRPSPEALPVLGAIPEFALTERSGRPVTRRDLEGQVWVADFIFTQCTGICPILSTRMAELKRRLRDAGITARLVSFSVDPRRDTPEVLREYAKRYAGDADDWWFVTGERDELYRLIGRGFLLSVAERSPTAAADSGELITHSDRFVLVDRAGQIRGYYHGTDEAALAELVRDAAALQGRR